MSYGGLDRLSDEAAAGFAARGLEPGDVLALLLPSGPDYVIAYLAAAKLGVATTGINPRLAPPERARALAVIDPALVLAAAGLADDVASSAPLLEVERSLANVRRRDTEVPDVKEDPERPVAIVLTSGTTGAPRGAVFGDRQLDAVRRMDAGDDRGGGGSMLASTELAHIGFMTKLPWYLQRGMRIHLPGRWRAATALRTIAEQRIPSVGGIAAQIALMLREPNFDRYDLSCVTQVIAGGGPSTPELIREARARFHAPYSVRYSSTESGGLGTLTALDAADEEALYTVGRPRPGIELEIRDDEGGALPTGTAGQVCFRSPSVMSRYHRDPDATAAALKDGWLQTGDLGYLDERGCLRLVGRAKDMFIRGGYNVHPQEVEAVLATHPRVRDVAVAPRPDQVMGEIGVAVIVPDGRAPTLDELRAHAAAHLAAYKLPEAIRVVEEIPLTAMHKIDRRTLANREERSS